MKKVNRSSVTGKFVTKSYAGKHKKTTQSEMVKQREKFKVYELDFGDTNLLSQNVKDITDWIEKELCGMSSDGKLEYTISIRMMTAKQINNIPEGA